MIPFHIISHARFQTKGSITKTAPPARMTHKPITEEEHGSTIHGWAIIIGHFAKSEFVSAYAMRNHVLAETSSVTFACKTFFYLVWQRQAGVCAAVGYVAAPPFSRSRVSCEVKLPSQYSRRATALAGGVEVYTHMCIIYGIYSLLRLIMHRISQHLFVKSVKR